MSFCLQSHLVPHFTTPPYIRNLICRSTTLTTWLTNGPTKSSSHTPTTTTPFSTSSLSSPKNTAGNSSMRSKPKTPNGSAAPPRRLSTSPITTSAHTPTPSLSRPTRASPQDSTQRSTRTSTWHGPRPAQSSHPRQPRIRPSCS